MLKPILSDWLKATIRKSKTGQHKEFRWLIVALIASVALCVANFNKITVCAQEADRLKLLIHCEK